MSGHTPGPWKATYGAVHTEDGRPIANMVWGDSATEAGIYAAERFSNAHLTAAAPELLAIVETIYYSMWSNVVPVDWVNRMGAAIAKTKGRAR